MIAPAQRIHHLLERTAARSSDAVALEDPTRGCAISYGELDALADEIRAVLTAEGVVGGDRVGIVAPKSIGVVASIFGILKAGGAYVPVDHQAPAQRNAFILRDCAVRTIVVARDRVASLGKELAPATLPVIAELPSLDRFGADLVLAAGPAIDPRAASGKGGESPGIAYILYTSGSTGTPKGVTHTHASALSFVDWCAETFEPTGSDRFSSHAPFHFDLSILDLFVPIRHGAAVVLIGEELGKQPQLLARVIADTRITVWYSTPSILRLLVEFGHLERYDFSALRAVLFAGEVFPVKHLRSLQEAWPRPRYYNLYGPTETNVCTWYEVPGMVPPGRAEPLPIGWICSNDQGRVVDELGVDVPDGVVGELCVAGGSVMEGYWNLPERSASAFLADGAGARWYRTGDLVRRADDGSFTFLGRRDRMVKRRGYRVELGEIEAALLRHPGIAEAAVVATQDEAAGVVLHAFVACEGNARPSLVDLKRFCAEYLPLYMIPERFSLQEALPKTSTDKTDYQSLTASLK